VARDYYDVLGVSRNASSDELQAAYRKLARTSHPDINKAPDAEDRFKEVNEAYHVLKDPDQRSRYDRFGPDFRSIPEGYERAAPRGGARTGRGSRAGRGGRPGDPFGGSAGGAGGGAGGNVYTEEDLGGIDLEELFGGMFGGRGRGGYGPMPGADQEAELTLSVEEAYSGGHRRITLPGPGGERSFEVDIPRGVTDGQRIRLAGEGGRGGGGGAAGDLYLVIRIAPHRRYRLVGRDIYVDLPVAPWEAALGATVPLDTPGGETKVQVPPGSSSGRRLRLRGQGMPNARGKPGDLYAEVRILVPRTLEPRERELFEELSRVSTFDPRRSS
jgi:curved DNA-binding protein